MSVNPEYLKRKYVTKVSKAAAKWAAAVTDPKAVERYKQGLATVVGGTPSADLITLWQEGIKSKGIAKYQAFASNAQLYADKWWENYKRAILGQ